MRILTITTIGFLLFLLSCTSGEKTVENTENTKVVEEETIENTTGEKMFLYNNDSTKVTWTAYKTTEKVGVGGQFTSVTVSNVIAAETPLDVLKEAKFSIPVLETITGNEQRDNRIVKLFFGMLTETENITGQVKSLNEDGTGSIAIVFNGVEQVLPITYTLDGLKIEVKGTMDLALWNAQKGIDALNEECKDLHAGADGVTKLWPTVDIVISTVLKKG